MVLVVVVVAGELLLEELEEDMVAEGKSVPVGEVEWVVRGWTRTPSLRTCCAAAVAAASEDAPPVDDARANVGNVFPVDTPPILLLLLLLLLPIPVLLRNGAFIGTPLMILLLLLETVVVVEDVGYVEMELTANVELRIGACS